MSSTGKLGTDIFSNRNATRFQWQKLLTSSTCSSQASGLQYASKDESLLSNHKDQQCFATCGSATIKKFTNCATVLYISNYIYPIVYTVYCYYLLAFIGYNSPNMHDYLYYTDYIFVQNIPPFLSPGFPAPRHMPTSDMEKSSARTSCPGNPIPHNGEKRTRLVFHC